MKIILFIRSLELGGAERQLLNLAEGLSKRHDVAVLTFYDADEYAFSADPSAKNKYRQISLNKEGRWDILGFATRFLRVVREIRPDVIYAFMSTASVISLLAPMSGCAVRIVWGVRSSNMRLKEYGVLPRLFRRLESRLSVFSDLVIANADAGRAEAIADGFRNRHILVIANGIDTRRFRRSEDAGRECRTALGIPLDSFIIGTVARHDPMKGLEMFLLAAAAHWQLFPDTYFLIIGSGPDTYTAALKDKARLLGQKNNVIWVPKTRDVVRYYSAMNIYTSASIYGEGFSNAVAEAMACETPCVVTDVGDSKSIVGDCGKVVEPDSPSAIAQSWSSLRELPSDAMHRLGSSARDRILRLYGIDVMVDKTEASILDVCHLSSAKASTRIE